ncbi:MAG: hypothetical protein ACYDB7_07720, partial [Mycobacteriales bacterium]
MSAQEWRVQVQPGDGVVASAPGVVILALPASSGQQTFTDGLLDLVGSPSTGDSTTAGRRLLRLVARAAAAAEPEDVPPFAVVADADPGVAVLLCGAVDLSVDSPRGMEMLSGRAAELWLDRILEPGFTSLAAAPSGETLPAPFPRSDLQSGVVGGRGFVLAPRGVAPALLVEPPTRPSAAEPVIESLVAVEPLAREPLPVEPLPVEPLPVGPTPTPVQVKAPVATPMDTAPSAPPEAVTSPEFVAVSLADPLPPEELVPLPIVDSGEAPELAVPGVQVHGIYCSRRHFNDPDAVYCSSCGISMVHQTHNRVV